MTNEQDWQDTLDDLGVRRERSRAMGGEERLAKHHGKGKLDARARVDHLLDKGTFREFGTLVGGDIAADGIVAGSGHDRRLAGDGRAPRTSPRSRAASGPAATRSATDSPNWRCATRFRW